MTWRNTNSDVGWRGCTAPQWSSYMTKNVISPFVRQLASSFICAFWPQFVRNPIIHGCSLKEFNFEGIVKIPSKYRSRKWEEKSANLRKKNNGGKGFHIVATHPDSEAGSDYMTSGMTLKKIEISLCSIWNVESFDCKNFLSFSEVLCWCHRCTSLLWNFNFSWGLATLVFGHLSALDRVTFIVVRYLKYSAIYLDQHHHLLQALNN